MQKYTKTFLILALRAFCFGNIGMLGVGFLYGDFNYSIILGYNFGILIMLFIFVTDE